MSLSQENLPADPGRRRRRRRSESSAAPAAAKPVFRNADDTIRQRLLITGWIVGLSYFPSGLLHAVAGDLVYLRDLALGIHLIICVVWLAKIRQLGWIAKHDWFILITPALLTPAVFNLDYTMEALRTCKWSFCWLDWIILGHLARQNKQWDDAFKLLLGITLFMMFAELSAGIYEWLTGDFLIKTEWGERTVFGVARGYDQMIGGKIRIHGLQRDVFSFANIMAMNAVGALAYLLVARKALYQASAVLWALVFGLLMVVSGGRSAIFGALAAAIYAASVYLFPRLVARFDRRYVVAWVLIAIMMSLVGVGHFTDFVGNNLLMGSYVGDAQSAFMRDDYWQKMLSGFVHKPLILIMGGPFVSLIDSQVDTMFHWADNQLLWNVYHLGLAGAVALGFVFYKVLQPDARDESERRVRNALILFLVFVIGEGIARESLTFIGCLPLFVLVGYASSTEMLAHRGLLPGVSSRRFRHTSSRGQD